MCDGGSVSSQEHDGQHDDHDHDDGSEADEHWVSPLRVVASLGAAKAFPRSGLSENAVKHGRKSAQVGAGRSSRLFQKVR
jgi:hypothetical protein